MKKLIALFGILAVVTATVLVSCQKENLTETMENKTVGTDAGFAADDRQPPTIGIGISFNPFRGKRWSGRHGVSPCTQGRGICDVEISIEADFGIITQKGVGVYEIEFMEEIGAQAGEEFYGEDEDPLVFPQHISNYFGFGALTMIPQNYVVEVNPEHPYGVVTVNCIESPIVYGSIWRPMGPVTFEHNAFMGCVPYFGFCSEPFPWPSGPLGNLGENQAAGQVTLVDGRYIVMNLDGNSLSQEFVDGILANPVFELSNPYQLPQPMLDELAAAAGVPSIDNVVYEAGLYDVTVQGTPSPLSKIKIKIKWDSIGRTLSIVIKF